MRGQTGSSGDGALAPADELSKALELSVQETRPNADAIKAAVMQNEVVPGAEVRRGFHLRVA
jgi:hypothetical protein